MTLATRKPSKRIICFKCAVRMLHPWHDDGTVNHSHVLEFVRLNAGPTYGGEDDARGN